MSNHAPVFVAITTYSPATCPSLYKINTKYLKDSQLLDKLKSMWEGLKLEVMFDDLVAAEKLFKGFYLTKRMIRTYGKMKAKEKRKLERELQEAMATTKIELEGAPQSECL